MLRKSSVKIVLKENWKYYATFRKKNSRDPPDVIIDNMELLSMLFLIGAVSPVGSKETERAAYETQWWKTTCVVQWLLIDRRMIWT